MKSIETICFKQKGKVNYDVAIVNLPKHDLIGITKK